MSDKECMQAVAEGDAEAIGIIVERYSRRIYALVRGITLSDADAEELTQDVFVKIYTSASKFLGLATLSTWIYRIACNTALSFVRKRRQRVMPIDERIIDSTPDDCFDEAHQLRLDLLRMALEELLPEERMLVTLFYTENMSVEQISAVTMLTSENVRVKLHRTRKKLYVMITEYERRNAI